MEFFLQAICLFLIIKSGESIKCHICMSDANSQCGDPFNTDNSLKAMECTPEAIKSIGSAINDLSSKLKSLSTDVGLNSKLFEISDPTKFICQKVTVQINDKTSTFRTCAPPKTDTIDACANFEKPGGKVTFCELCDKDECNAASGVIPGYFLITLLAAMGLATIFRA